MKPENLILPIFRLNVKTITMNPSRAIMKFFLPLICAFYLHGSVMAQKQVDSLVTCFVRPAGDSVNGVKIASEYNEAGKLASYSIYSWDSGRNRWDGWSFPCEECSAYRGRYEYTYDEKGRLASTSSFYWNYSLRRWALGNTGRKEDGYDDQGNNISIIYSIWNKATNEWVPDFGYEYTYDEAGHVTSRMIYDRFADPQTWHPLEKMLYAFDGNGRKILETRQLWSDTARDWVNQVKTEWYYDSPGDTTEYASFKWSLAGNYYEWHEDERHRVIKESDPDGNLVLTTVALKISKTRWTPTMKEERAYNSAGQQVLSVISKGYGSLTEDFRSEWVYDPDGRLIQETLTGSQVRWPGGMAITRKAKTIRSLDEEGNTTRVVWNYWDAQTKTYILNSKDYYFYHPAASSSQETGIEEVRVYPNPTRGILNLSGLSQPAVVKIYSMQGMLLRSFQQVATSVDISGLPPGAYLILVSEGNHPPFRTLLMKE
jgi:hypothetical protein